MRTKILSRHEPQSIFVTRKRSKLSKHPIGLRFFAFVKPGAGSKLRTCALGPELVIDPAFDSISGEVKIERAGTILWSKRIRTGEAEMCHSLQNIEHHHFKYEAHRRPGDIHVHFLGADCLSFGDGVRLIQGDTVQIQFDFGRPLRNTIQIATAPAALIMVNPLAGN